MRKTRKAAAVLTAVAMAAVSAAPVMADEIMGVIISPMIMLRRLWENRPFQTPFSLNVMNEGIVL